MVEMLDSVKHIKSVTENPQPDDMTLPFWQGQSHGDFSKNCKRL